MKTERAALISCIHVDISKFPQKSDPLVLPSREKRFIIYMYALCSVSQKGIFCSKSSVCSWPCLTFAVIRKLAELRNMIDWISESKHKGQIPHYYYYYYHRIYYLFQKMLYVCIDKGKVMHSSRGDWGRQINQFDWSAQIGCFIPIVYGTLLW